VARAFSDPKGPEARDLSCLDEYCREADLYLDDLLRLVPEPVADDLRVSASTRALRGPRDLLERLFHGPDPRTRYEAQRKVYLAKLLFDIDHCRTVRDGLRHRLFFEKLMGDILWDRIGVGDEIEICCRLERDDRGEDHLRVGVPPTPDAKCWSFHVRRLCPPLARTPIEIFHYRSRHKRETNPAPPAVTDEGYLTLTEEVRWPGLGGRSGSILSKMIRRGIPDPAMVQDMLGAMFIVGDPRQAYGLEHYLVRSLGGPLRWRDRVDTLTGQRDRSRLDPSSSRAFRVLKSIVDVLLDDVSTAEPYLFAVEVQIYPLEDYLHTLYDVEFTSHFAYKRRQFLRELIPLLFPTEVYGEATRLLGPTLP
jgi:hypothetical protein